MKTKRYYLFPFLDQILAVLVCLLFTMFFGSWFPFKIFGIICGIIFSLVLCGFMYSRMWRLSRKNIRYQYGLSPSSGVKFVLPLCIFNFIIILVYVLAKHNVIPIQDIIVQSYYLFPENADRVKETVTLMTHVQFYLNMWFAFFVPFTNNMPAWLMCLAPILTICSAALGFKLGSQNKELSESTAKVIEKAKDKFNS